MLCRFFDVRLNISFPYGGPNDPNIPPEILSYLYHLVNELKQFVESYPLSFFIVVAPDYPMYYELSTSHPPNMVLILVNMHTEHLHTADDAVIRFINKFYNIGNMITSDNYGSLKDSADDSFMTDHGLEFINTYTTSY